MSRKKPSADHKRDGTLRSYHGNDSVPVSEVEPPWQLSERAESHFHRIAEKLHRNNLTTEIDAEALALMAESVDDYLTARETVLKEGQLSVGSKGTIYTNPAYHNMNTAFKRMTQLIKKFGMTPVDRTGLDCGEENSDDILEKMMQRSRN